MPLIKIDDREIEIQKGETVFNAAKRNGIDIPFYCYHPGLKIVASCRMCLVEMVGMPKLMPACSTTVPELPAGKKLEDKYDAIVLSESEKTTTARAAVLEFLLLNHPIDCPICDKAGECKLQDYSYEHGHGYSRFVETKKVPRKRDLGPTIMLYPSRCIMCSRCVRFTDEITGTEELKVTHRGAREEIDIVPGRPLNNKMMGNVVDLCPVGCLIDKHEKFEGRVWNFVQTESVCPGCSKGCNTVLDTMKHQKLNLEELVDKVYRIRPRENMDVNQWWICDDGRYHLEEFSKQTRIELPAIRPTDKAVDATWGEALAIAVEKIKTAKASDVLLVGSPHASNEENYLLGKLAKAMGFAVDVTAPLMGDTQTFKTEVNKYPFTIESEKAPNFRGAKDTLHLSSSGFDSAVKGKKVVLMLNTRHAVLTEKPSTLVAICGYEDAVTAKADVLLPGALFTESSGTYTNKDGRVQKFNKAIEPHGETRPVWQILADLALGLGHEWSYGSIEDVAREMLANTYPSADMKTLYPQSEWLEEQIVA
jgi:NADH-quinone oxidoreductase subunit G